MLLNKILLYIDPGTGSIILQAIAAGIIGVGLFIKFEWHRLLRFFGFRKEEKADPSDENKIQKNEDQKKDS